MKVRILGSGTSTGIPEIGCTCAVCASQDPHDNRLRASSLIYTDDATLLIDCGPDFRIQMLNIPFSKIDAVLISHEHYDHIGGLDDLRPFCRLGEIPVFAETHTANALRTRMSYCFAENKYPGIPHILLHDVKAGCPFYVNRTEIIPIRVMHGSLPILGYRIGKLAYITDMLTMPEESYKQLEGIELLIINALRQKKHMTHQNFTEALESTKRIGALETYFIHMSHSMGLHTQIEKLLPAHVHLAYDGLEIKYQ